MVDPYTIESYSYNLKPEYTKEYNLDYKIRLGDGSEFTMPITFAELETKGWFLQNSSDPDRDMASKYMTWGIIENTYGNTLNVAAYNPTNSTIKFKECTVINLTSNHFSSFDYEQKVVGAIDFLVCDSLSNASTLEDIISKLGNPYSLSCFMHYNEDGTFSHSEINVTYQQKSSAGSLITFKLSGYGNYILSLSYNIAPK